MSRLFNEFKINLIDVFLIVLLYLGNELRPCHGYNLIAYDVEQPFLKGHGVSGYLIY